MSEPSYAPEPLRLPNGRIVQATPGPCLWCGTHVELGRIESGATGRFDPAWHDDGDFGCDESPETKLPEDEQDDKGAIGEHCRPYDVARMMLALAEVRREISPKWPWQYNPTAEEYQGIEGCLEQYGL